MTSTQVMGISTQEKPKNRQNGAFLLTEPLSASLPGFPLISTGLQPGESDYEGTSAASAASSARAKATKAAPQLPCICNTALKRGANESWRRIET